VRRVAPRHPDPFASRVLARAELMYGDGAAADGLLDQLLAASPDDVELLYLKGLRHVIAGRQDAPGRAAHFRRAQALLARAHRADPNHVPTLYAYAESLSTRPQFLTENTQNILMLAVQLAPQVPQIRLSAAHLLLLREQYELAESVLLPLTSAVHQQSAAERTKELLSLARSRQRPPNDHVFEPLAPDDEGGRHAAAPGAGRSSAALPPIRRNG
jgi:Flp pilus assembly protein TadD